MDTPLPTPTAPTSEIQNRVFVFSPTSVSPGPMATNNSISYAGFPTLPFALAPSPLLSAAPPQEQADLKLLPQPRPDKHEPRVIVLCFDGSGNKFGEENSNVLRFFRSLVKSRQKEQIVYYQPGSGAYNKRSFVSHILSTVASKVDEAVALHVDDEVKDGYRFIVQNYLPGDKICLFGFSRGAHIARAVAGMIYKVGILPKENIQQIDFAFNIYCTAGYNGYKLSREFRETFSIPDSMAAEFVGVWDTVSSVGIIPQTHPYTSLNYAVKTFRHALALDERRARFRPNVWSEVDNEHEQDMEVNIPELEAIGNVDRDSWDYKPPKNRNYADVKEVWFSGCHADVGGGGSYSARRSQSLSYTPLRWMIKESILARTGILFDMDYLKGSLDFDFRGLVEEINEKDMKDEMAETYAELEKYASHQPMRQIQIQTHPKSDRLLMHAHNIFDQLLIIILWWILEIIPTLYTYQDQRGNWIRRRMRNFGRGRHVPFYKNEIQIHKSVEERIEGTKNSRAPYVPSANNWEAVRTSPMLKWVK